MAPATPHAMGQRTCTALHKPTRATYAHQEIRTTDAHRGLQTVALVNVNQVQEVLLATIDMSGPATQTAHIAGAILESKAETYC